VTLDSSAIARVHAARAVVERLGQGDTPIYGLNSALGANTGARVAPADRAAYQARAVRARAVGIGAPYPAPSVRAILAARIAGMAQGGSGVSPSVLDGLVALLNAGVHPRVPRIGSVGAADLAQLSHLALPLIGEGEAEYRGVVMPGAEALARAGLAPVTLGAKDGLALVSANAAAIGRASLVLHDARTLLDDWLVGVALSFEGFHANLSPLDARAVQARPAPGQVEVAARLRALLAGGALPTRAPRRVQDPLSFRVVAQVHGAGLWMLQECERLVELELRSAADSPLVLAEDDVMLSNGNFDAAALTLALQALALALAGMANLAAGRVLRMMAPTLSGLPLQLTRHGPAHSGFATLQKTTTVLATRIRRGAQPAALDGMPVSDSVEDHAPMTLCVVDALASLLDDVRRLVAIEQIVAAQAIDLRGVASASLGVGLREPYARLRAHVAALDEDRPLGPAVDRMAALLAQPLLTVESP
jgi:histidine ammonia-lyase